MLCFVQALKLSWTEVGYREPSDSDAATALDRKRQRLDHSIQGDVRATRFVRSAYRRSLRVDGSRCLSALDGDHGRRRAEQPGAAGSGVPGSAHHAGIANGIAIAGRQLFGGLLLEPVSNDGEGEQELASAPPTDAARRWDSTRWQMTLRSPYLAALKPVPADFGRAVHRVPDGVVVLYSLTAGLTLLLQHCLQPTLFMDSMMTPGC